MQYLQYRPGIDAAWQPIDPTTPQGAAMLTALGIDPKEIAMTATAEKTSTAKPAAETITKMGLLLQARQQALRLYDKLATTARSAWGWVYETFHVSAATSRAQSAYAWGKAHVLTATRFLGVNGAIGVGSLLVSTETGRKVIGLALTPVVWVAKQVTELWADGYVWVEKALMNGDGKSGIRNKVSNAMTDFRHWLFGTGDPADGHGVVGDAAIAVFKFLAPHLSTESLAMRTTRSAGTVLVGFKIAGLLGYLPFGGFNVILQTVFGGLVAAAAAVPFERELTTAQHAIEGYVNRTTETAKDVINGALVEDATVAATAVAGDAPAQNGNRAARRAAGQRGAKAGAR